MNVIMKYGQSSQQIVPVPNTKLQYTFLPKVLAGALLFFALSFSSCYSSEDYLGFDKPNAFIMKVDGTTLDFSQNMVRTDNNGNYFAQEPEGQLFDSNGEGGNISLNVDSPNDFANSYLTYIDGNQESFSSFSDGASLEITVESSFSFNMSKGIS